MNYLGLILILFAPTGDFRTGADRLFDDPYLEWIRGKRVGLVTNQTGVDSNLELTAHRLERRRDVRLTALFAPEHGLAGQNQAGEPVVGEGRIYSLYGESRGPTQEMLEDVDVLLYDIQDVGVRFYTFISTMTKSMEAASSKGIPFVVLDRPAPLNGNATEGPVLARQLESFVGIHPIPIRYAMTPGELAGLVNEEKAMGADLRVVPMQGWKREDWYDSTGLAWVAPSPNMPNLETATVYPGFCLFEGTNLSEGRGTTRPFQLIGAPWLDSGRLVRELNRLKLPGVVFRPQAFTPTFSKHEGSRCNGVQVHVRDREKFRSVETALSVLSHIRRLHPDRFLFRERAFDRLAGDPDLRRKLLEGAATRTIVGSWSNNLREFRRRRAPHLIY